LRDESCVAWDVLGFKSICWSTDPSISFSWSVCKLEVFTRI
jgi:hypothetical protein